LNAHVTALYRKLRCEHRTQLALWALSHGVRNDEPATPEPASSDAPALS
jgi:hypothetical protein